MIHQVAGLGMSLCADKLDELKSGRLPGTSSDPEADDAATQEALQRHEIFERHRVRRNNISYARTELSDVWFVRGSFKQSSY